MGRIFMILTTIIAIIIIFLRNLNRNVSIYKKIKKVLRDTNTTYRNLFKEKSLLIRNGQIIMLIGAEFFISITVSVGIIKNFDLFLAHRLDLLVKLILILGIITVIHYSVGYVLLIISRIHAIFHSVEDKTTKIDLLLSYFILSSYFTILILLPDEFKKNYIIGLVGVIICYILNLKVLVNVIRNPATLKIKEENSFNSILVSAILIIILIIINLFLGVCFISSISPDSYTNVSGNIDLFYYTIMTFTTIGYGDIVPVTIGAKLMAVVIAITSVICIGIFLSTILSYTNNKGES